MTDGIRPDIRRACAESRRAEVWTDGDVRRVMAGMRAGEPPEKTALVLRRTVSAVLTKMSQVRRIYPETMWRRV